MNEKLEEQAEPETATELRQSVAAIVRRWAQEEEELWRQWQWCKDHNFQLEMISINERRELLRRKRNELEDILERA